MRSQRVGSALLVLIALFCITLGAAAQQSVVNFWYYGAASDFDVLERFVEEFEAENPDIKVEVTAVPYTDTWEKWAVAVAGGTPPDASMATFGIFNVMPEALQPIDELLEVYDFPHLVRESFFPAHWDSNVVDGHLLGLPFRANSQVILYDKQVFLEAGISDVPTTWSELSDLATRLTRRTGDTVERWGFSFRNAALNRTVNHFAQRNGWDKFDYDFTESRYLDDALIQTLEFLNDMVAREVAAIPGSPGVGALASGRVAMLNDGPWQLAYMRAGRPDIEVGAFAPPLGPSGRQPYANFGGENLVMFKGAKDPEATLRFLSYLAYERNADYVRATEAFFPVVRYAAADPYWLESDVWRAVLENYDVGMLPNLRRPCGVRFASEEAYNRALENIFYQITPVRTALEEVHRIAQNDLANEELLRCLGR